MPAIRNSELIKKFTDFFRLKTNDMLDSEAGRMLVPVVSVPILPTIVRFTPTEAELATGIDVPSSRKWRILSLFLRWTSDANAGNREIKILVNDPVTGERMFENASRNFQAASLAVGYNFFPDGNSVGSSSGLFQEIAIPNVILSEGSRITVSDGEGIAAGDTVTNATLIVEEEIVTDGEFIER